VTCPTTSTTPWCVHQRMKKRTQVGHCRFTSYRTYRTHFVTRRTITSALHFVKKYSSICDWNYYRTLYLWELPLPFAPTFNVSSFKSRLNSKTALRRIVSLVASMCKYNRRSPSEGLLPGGK